MPVIDPTILNTDYDGLSVVKLTSGGSCETLLIALEKAHTFPEHTSPRDALLVVLEGDITFSINNSKIQIKKHQTFKFKAEIPHTVFANSNAKFLIIR